MREGKIWEGPPRGGIGGASKGGYMGGASNGGWGVCRSLFLEGLQKWVIGEATPPLFGEDPIRVRGYLYGPRGPWHGWARAPTHDPPIGWVGRPPASRWWGALEWVTRGEVRMGAAAAFPGGKICAERHKLKKAYLINRKKKQLIF